MEQLYAPELTETLIRANMKLKDVFDSLGENPSYDELVRNEKIIRGFYLELLKENLSAKKPEPNYQEFYRRLREKDTVLIDEHAEVNQEVDKPNRGVFGAVSQLADEKYNEYAELNERKYRDLTVGLLGFAGGVAGLTLGGWLLYHTIMTAPDAPPWPCDDCSSFSRGDYPEWDAATDARNVYLMGGMALWALLFFLSGASIMGLGWTYTAYYRNKKKKAKEFKEKNPEFYKVLKKFKEETCEIFPKLQESYDRLDKMENDFTFDEEEPGKADTNVSRRSKLKTKLKQYLNLYREVTKGDAANSPEAKVGLVTALGIMEPYRHKIADKRSRELFYTGVSKVLGYLWELKPDEFQNALKTSCDSLTKYINMEPPFEELDGECVGSSFLDNLVQNLTSFKEESSKKAYRKGIKEEIVRCDKDYGLHMGLTV
jgi:hypothetical protein